MISTKSQNIVQAIFADDGDVTMACADVLIQIENLTMAGDTVSWAVQYPELHRHVMACGHCRAVIHDLQWVFEQAAANTLIEPTTYPSADLSFLPDPLTRLRQRMGQVTSQGHFWMRNTHGAVWLSLAQYLLARPLRANMKSPSANEHLVHLACEPDDQLVIELVADDAGDDRVTITAHVRQPARFHRGYGGSQVSLHLGTEQRNGLTNEAGRVVFSHVPATALPDLVVQITPCQCE